MTAALLCLAIGLAFGYLATRSISPPRPIITLARPSNRFVVEHPNGAREQHVVTAERYVALLDQCQAQHRQLVKYADEKREWIAEQNEAKRWQRALN